MTNIPLTESTNEAVSDVSEPTAETGLAASAELASAPPSTEVTAATPQADFIRLGFSRGIAPSKWANRWAAAVPEVPLTLVPLTIAGKVPQDEAPVDVMLIRTAPGVAPEGSEAALQAAGSEAAPTIFAMHLYTESLALVVAADDDLAKLPAVDNAVMRDVTLLGSPVHAPEWPATQPWADPSYAPKNVTAALELVATGMGGMIMSLPMARHLTRKRTHAVLPLTVEPALPGTEVWATWAVDRDAGDVQQLVGIMRGRTARSQREGVHAPEPSAKERVLSAKALRYRELKAQQQKQAKKIAKLPKNSRGAQLAAAQEKRDNLKRLRRQEKRNGR